MNRQTEADERPGDGIDDLLPWHVTGRLGAADAERVEAALARDPDLARRLALAEEEFAETVALNEALGAPSVKVRDALFARIDSGSSAKGGRWTNLIAALSPRTLAWGAAAAALVIAVQAGFLGALLANREAGFVTASDSGTVVAGSRLLIAFAPEATAAQIAALLQSHRASIVDGPRPGGIFQVRIGDRTLSEAELQQVAAALRGQAALIRFVAPSP